MSSSGCVYALAKGGGAVGSIGLSLSSSDLQYCNVFCFMSLISISCVHSFCILAHMNTYQKLFIPCTTVILLRRHNAVSVGDSKNSVCWLYEFIV